MSIIAFARNYGDSELSTCLVVTCQEYESDIVRR